MVAERMGQQTKAGAAPKPEGARAAESKGRKRDLAGKSFAEQEAMLAPGAERKAAPVGGASEQAADAATPAPVAAPSGSGAPALGADALVLSRDPQYAKSGFVPWFADQVKGKVESWGLAADAGAVSLACEGGQDVVALSWSGAWGTKPATRELGLEMRPLDAKAAVTGAHALGGFGALEAKSKAKLDALLGGETNLLSEAARNHLRPKFGGLAAKKEDEQAATLEGIIGVRDAAPQLADEQVETGPATVALTGPTDRAGYPFAGGAADASVYQAAYGDGTTIEIVAPKAPDPALHNHSVQEAADAARYLPHNSRVVVKTILLNTRQNPDDAHWAVEYNTPDFHSYMTAGAAGIVTIYPDRVAPPSANVMRGSMIHETGHAWSYQSWGEDTTKGKWVDWKTAMDADRVSVSGYAMNAIAEDVAETVRVYGSTKGKPKYDEYKAMIPNRMTMLEKELG